jgi:hypothetical protein
MPKISRTVGAISMSETSLFAASLDDISEIRRTGEFMS